MFLSGVIKSPKFYLTDSGVLCHILGVSLMDNLLSSSHKGEMIETILYGELLKHISYRDIQPKIYHYRVNDKKEIDFIVEREDKILAIEVKLSKQLTRHHLNILLIFKLNL